MQTTATTPVIYALGALTTGLSLAVVLCCLLVVAVMQWRRARHGSDAGRGV
jgi:putative spermidine/putrescine transport system permease protein